MGEQSEFVSAQDIADRLGTSTKHVRGLGIPSYKLGQLVRYRKDDVDAFIEKAKQC